VPAGYSATPLARKLGIREGDVVATVNAPPDLPALLDEIPDGVELRSDVAAAADVVLLFATERATLESKLSVVADAIFPDGAIWVAWPKRASKVETDITEDVVREIALPARLVDNKVCAISDVWSGLRVVWRRNHRVPAS
jgi:hypothetical protein